MYLKEVLARFEEESPVSLMARELIEHAMSAPLLDAVFERAAKGQYVRSLLFSTVVDLMSSVVTRSRKSIHAAYQAARKRIPVSVAALYAKLNGIEPPICEAMVRDSAGRLQTVIETMGGQMPPWRRGYRLRIVDGNHIAATERRLDVIRGSIAGPLPGQSLVLLDPALMLATDVIACEDGHAQERSMTEPLLQLIAALDVILADRNFCTSRLLWGIAERLAFFIIRQHAANVRWEPAGKCVLLGTIPTGEVWEQPVTLLKDGQVLAARRITIKLAEPTRDGDDELHILSNLPADVTGIEIALAYAGRWTVETLFQELTVYLRCELNTLGYPRAALLGFCVALAAYNVLSTVKAALRAEYGHKKVQEDVSDFYIADEIGGTYRGMMIAIPAEHWEPFREISAVAFADRLRILAQKVDLPAFKKHVRGAKKPVPPRTRFRKHTHVSTARLLAAKKTQRKPP